LTSGIENGKLTDASLLTIQIVERLERAYVDSHADLAAEELSYLERHTVLEAIDRLWQEHLYAMDQLRANMSLRVYAQKDPLVEYKHEAFGIFKSMMDQVYKDVAHNLFRVTLTRLSSMEELQANMPQEMIHQLFGQFDGNFPEEMPQPEEEIAEPEPQITFHRAMPKVGRNEPCPCGSGKKFKACCGKNG
jgi:preprotein translocase subunit SecA